MSFVISNMYAFSFSFKKETNFPFILIGTHIASNLYCSASCFNNQPIVKMFSMECKWSNCILHLAVVQHKSNSFYISSEIESLGNFFTQTVPIVCRIEFSGAVDTKATSLFRPVSKVAFSYCIK